MTATHLRLAETTAERNEWMRRAARLAEALRATAEGMDRAGGDGYGMPECPWCYAQTSTERSEDQHDDGCELVAARVVLVEYAAASGKTGGGSGP